MLCNPVMDLAGWRSGGTACAAGFGSTHCYYKSWSKACTPQCPDGETESCRLTTDPHDELFQDFWP